MNPKDERHPHRFQAEGDFISRLEGDERRTLIPVEEIVPRMGLSAESIVVDLGAGIGYFSLPIAERARAVVALDLEPRMLSVLADRIKESGTSNIHLVRGDITELPLAQSSVNDVLAAFVYHEVSDPTRFLQQCAMALVPSGTLTIIDFQKRETPIGPPVEHRKTPAEVGRAAQRLFWVEEVFETEVYYQIRFRRSL